MATSDGKEFPKKYLSKLKDFAPDHAEKIDQSDTNEIKKFILTSERNLYEIEIEKDNNEKLQQMKDELKEAMGPFTEAKSTETAKIKYCLFVLENRGVKI